jgi:hypothetical protein
MARHFKNHVHYTDPDTGQVTRFQPGEECPEEIELEIDENNFIALEDYAAQQKASYGSLNKEQLVALAAERGLDVEGTKAELIVRLEQSDGALS